MFNKVISLTMFLRFVLYIACISCINCSILNLVQKNESDQQNLIELPEIPGKTVIIVSEKYHESFIEKTIQNKMIYKFKQKINHLNKLYKIDMYIISLDTSFPEMIQYLSKQLSWNARAKFLVLSQKNGTNILQEAYKHNILNIIVIDTKTNIIYRFLFNENACEKHPKIMASFSENLTDLILQKNVYNFKNFTQCNIRIHAMPIVPYIFQNEKTKKLDGIEILALEAQQKYFKFKMDFVKHNFKTWGVKMPNNSYTFMYGVLEKLQTDIVIGMCPGNYTLLWDFDVTQPYLADRLVWIVPRAGLMPHWSKIVHVYPFIVWTLSIILVVTLPVIWSRVSKILRIVENGSFESWAICQLRTYSMFLGVSVPQTPKSTTLRILFSIWTVANLILITIYQSKLISALTNPEYEHQISNPDELLASKLEIGFNLNLFYFFDEKYDEDKKVIQKAKLCDLTLGCLNRTAFQKDFAVAKSFLSVYYLQLKSYHQPDGSSLFYIFKSSLFVHYVHTIIVKGHPIFDKFNQVTIRLIEAGFYQYWLEKILTESIKKNSNGDNDETNVLSLHEMEPAFYFLLFGLGLALTVFILELFSGVLTKL